MKQRIRPEMPSLPDDLNPAVKWSRAPPPQVATTVPVKQSRFAAEMQSRQQSSPIQPHAQELQRLADEGPSFPKISLPSTVSDIVERSSSSSSRPVFTPTASKSGFPAVQKRPLASSKPKESIFKQNLRSKEPINPVTAKEPASDDFKAENDQRIAAMTEEEIIEERARILESLDASTVEFLKKRIDQPIPTSSTGSSKSPEKKTRFAEDVKVGTAAPKSTATKIEPPSWEPENIDDQLEAVFAKAAIDRKRTLASLRFDIQGKPVLLTDDDAPQSTEHYSHHSELPDIASSPQTFTIPDLHRLACSTVPAQRATSLSTLFKVASIALTSTGAPNQTLSSEAIDMYIQAASRGILDRNVSLASLSIDIIHLLVESTVSHRSAANALLTSDISALRIFGRLFREFSLPLPEINKLIHVLVLVAENDKQGVASTEIAEAEGLLDVLVHRCVGNTWPLNSSDEQMDAKAEAAIQTSKLLIALVQSSRANAISIVNRDLHSFFYPFVSLSPSSLPAPVQQQTADLMALTLSLWQSLATYGLACSVYSSIQNLLPSIATTTSSAAFKGVRIAWYRLLAAWIVAGTDPHVTSPEHSLIWTQVDHLNGELFDALERDLKAEQADIGILAEICNALACWLEGSRINGQRHGQAALEQLTREVESAAFVNLLNKALEDLQQHSKPEDKLRLVSALVRLHIAASHINSSVSILPLNQLSDIFTAPQSGSSWSIIEKRLAVSLGARISLEQRASKQIASNLLQLLPGDEELAAKSIDVMVSSLSNQNTSRFTVLKPFLARVVGKTSLIDGGSVAPLFPKPQDLPRTSTLRFDSQTSLLKPDWMFCALDELLQSGSSEVFDSLPENWEYSEVDIVKATLELAEAFKSSLTSSHVIFGLMKVFMLEKDQEEQSNSVKDIFRHESIAPLIAQHLSSLPPPLSTDSLENVSSSFLKSTPFFQFYTDFVALYDQISFSDPSFGLLLLPPLSMKYAVDYRRRLWADYPHILRNLTMKSSQIPLEQPIASFFYPAETDPSILGAMSEALVVGQVTRKDNKFIYTLACHHIVHAIFDKPNDRLGKMIFGRAGAELKNDLLAYHNAEMGFDLESCFEDIEQIKRERSALLDQWQRSDE